MPQFSHTDCEKKILGNRFPYFVENLPLIEGRRLLFTVIADNVNGFPTQGRCYFYTPDTDIHHTKGLGASRDRNGGMVA